MLDEVDEAMKHSKLFSMTQLTQKATTTQEERKTRDRKVIDSTIDEIVCQQDLRSQTFLKEASIQSRNESQFDQEKS